MKIVFFCSLLLGLFMTPTAYATFPEKSITIIVPATAGSQQDIATRALAPVLKKELGVNIVIKNIGGAGGSLGAAAVSSAAPDGYTIGYLSTGPVLLQPQVRNLPYKVDSFTPVAGVNVSPMMLLVKGDSPMNSVADAKKFIEEKGTTVFGSPGPGSMTHIASVAFFDALGVNAKHMPDVGGAEIIKNLTGGHLQFFVDTATYLTVYDLKALGIFADKRDSEHPDVPTMKEQGYDLEFAVWTGILAPKGLPSEIMDKLEKAVQAAVASPEFQDIAEKNGIHIHFMNSKDFGVFLEQKATQGKELIEKYNMRLE